MPNNLSHEEINLIINALDKLTNELYDEISGEYDENYRIHLTLKIKDAEDLRKKLNEKE